MLYRAYCMGLPHDWENFDQAPAGRHHVFFDHDEDSDTPVHEALAIELAVRWNVPVCSLSICNVFDETELVHHAELAAALTGTASPGMPWAWMMDGWDHGRPGLVDPDRMVCLVDDETAALLRESLDSLLQHQSQHDLAAGLQVEEIEVEEVKPAPVIRRTHVRLPQKGRKGRNGQTARLRPPPCQVIKRLRAREQRIAERALCARAGVALPPPPPRGFGKRLTWARTTWEQHRETAVFTAQWRLVAALPPVAPEVWS
ncbi:hypothetical protein [Ideonella dechloratans]|uniref:hypothetical protein n=1 Tax=Ideonella dechloratans TaxID=36863 RepID=UPI0035AE5379